VDLPEDEAQHLLDAWPVARLATAGPRGPHLVPVVFARAGGALWAPVDGKPKRAGEPARLRHVRADPRVSLLLDRYDEDWRLLWWLRVDGEARAVAATGPAADAEAPAALAALRAKYPQYQRVPLLGPGPPTLLRVAPRRLAGWCAGPEALAAIASPGPQRFC
jgi:PPOX class probable F420-dependent enzyme